MRSVKEWLSRTPGLSAIGDQAARQAFWRSWLNTRLPEDLAARITGVAERDGLLTVFAESAAWSARLRFALMELDQAVREADPNIKRVCARVMPGR